MSKKSLLAQAKSVTIGKRTPPCWYDKLDANTRAQVDELLAAFLSGELKQTTGQDWTVIDINRLILKPNGIEISDSSFRKWIAKHGTDAASASRESTAKRR